MKTFIYLIFFMFLTPLTWASQQDQVRQANELFKKQQWDSAVDLYLNALEHKENVDVVQYDLGTTFYKQGNYEQAREHLQKAVLGKNKSLSAKAHYNLGNTFYKSGKAIENKNIDEAISLLQKSVEDYGKASSLNPKDKDAMFNRDIVDKELERLKKKKKDQDKKQQEQNKQQSKQDPSQQNKQDSKNSQENKNNEQKSSQDSSNQQKKEDAGKQEEAKQQEEAKKQEEQAKQGKEKQQQAQQAQEEKDQSKKAQGQQQQVQEGQKESVEEKQARELLEEYERQDAPKGLLNFFDRHKGESHVDKDW